MQTKTTRRDFLKKSTRRVAGLSVSGLRNRSVAALIVDIKKRVIGANDKIRVGFIGVGNRGTQLLHLFMEQPDCEVAALCDVYEPYVTRDLRVHERYVRDMKEKIPRMGESFPIKVKTFKDYRLLLEDNEIDAVCIGTPDHRHALQTIDAIDAGKMSSWKTVVENDSGKAERWWRREIAADR